MLDTVKTAVNSLALWPVPVTEKDINSSERHWFPFLEHISKRSKEPIEDLIGYIRRREIQVLLAVDEKTIRTVAIAGVRFWKRGDDLIGDIVWCTGHNRREWQHLMAEIERYLKDQKCAVCRPICRRGWSRMLAKEYGYRPTHVIMEKNL